MSNASPILPFPADVDREAFANWLSGFIDGEGSFLLHFNLGAKRRDGSRQRYPRAVLCVQLRSDDGPILHQIRSFFGCGQISNRQPRFKKPNPSTEYRVTLIEDLVKVVVPHFDRYPLRAKKSRDFAIWREAVILLASMKAQQERPIRAAGRGASRKWSAFQRDHFASLIADLKTRLACTPPCQAPADLTPPLNS